MNRNTQAVFGAMLAGSLALLLVCALPENRLSPDALQETVPETVPETLPAPLPETLPATLSETAPVPAKKVNILLIGRDSSALPARSDAMILCTFDPVEKSLTLTSLLRDLWIDIPGHGQDRINAAYAYGGRALLDETIESAFDIPIHGNVEVDFDSFAALTDLLGGVDLELRKDEAREISRVTGTPLEEGLQHLSGPQALAFARIRKLDPDGDFSRTERQRRLLCAMASAGRALNAGELMVLAREALPLVETDFSLKEILALSGTVLPIMDNGTVRSQHVPQNYFDRIIRGMAVLEADRAETAAFLQRTAGCR